MGKAKREKAQLKATPISKFESRPWKCPRCFKRVKTKAGLIGHWKGKHARLPVPTLLPSARDSLKLRKSNLWCLELLTKLICLFKLTNAKYMPYNLLYSTVV